MLKAVTLKEIERIFEIIEPLGISREAVVIPLRPEHPGRVRILPNGKLRSSSSATTISTNGWQDSASGLRL